MPAKMLATLQTLDFKKAHVTLSVVDRTLVNRGAHYTALRVEMEEPLRKKLAGVLASAVKGVTRVQEYEHVTEDQDDAAYQLGMAETDFRELRPHLDKGTDSPRAKSYKDLLDAWLYVVRAAIGDTVVYGFRLVSKNWSTKKASFTLNAVFDGEVLVDLDQKAVFRIDDRIDFFCVNDKMIILDKRNFETALNFRARMEHDRDAVIQEFGSLGLFQDASLLTKVVGDNMWLLRRIGMVQKSGYYKDPNYIEKLHAVLREREHWKIKVIDGKIILDEDNAPVVLTLLNNGRLESIVNDEIFDVAVKKKVE